MKKIIIILLCFFAWQSHSQNNIIPRHGSYESAPGEKWEDAFVSGNGRMGALFYGNPGDETLIANHCRLFLPLGNREIVPDLVEHIPLFRQIYREKGPNEAQQFILGKAMDQGFPGLIPTDPYHPGFFVKILHPAQGEVTDYVRTENFRTGEVITCWKDDRGQFQRKMFVSRTDNVIVLSISGPGACELDFPKLEQELIDSHVHISPDWIGCHNIYAKGKGGYDTGVRIVRKGGKTEVSGNKIKISDSDEILLFIRIVPWKTPLPKQVSEAWANSVENPDFKDLGKYTPNPPLVMSSVVSYLSDSKSKSLMPKLKESLMKGFDADYQTLLASHAKEHSALFDRVVFDLDAGRDRQKTTSELIREAEEKKILSKALMEKMYDAGRYMLICSAGELPPNLQGIWTGTWEPAWSADFTLDTNLQAAMASACSGNLTELMEGYFRLMESYYPEWRMNAQKMYGCRGMLTNARASNTALLLHWGNWPGNYWTAGCGWLAGFFSDYVRYTGDIEFLRERCLPLLKEIALFYEDFLCESNDGKVEFIPSYNPETGPGINATMDIAVVKHVLTDLIYFSRRLNTNADDIEKWELILRKLPPFPINNGALTEWPDGGISPSHRHHSQLYSCFQSFDPLFETDMPLRAAAQSTVHLKIEGLDGGKGTKGQQTSFSRVQCGISAAYLGMAEEAYGRLQVMATMRSMNPGLITSHDPNAYIFNTDGNGGIPQIVATMLAFSREDCVDLLRSLPTAWQNGSIHGLNLACGCIVDITWKDGELTSAIFHATRDTFFKVTYKGMKKEIRIKKGDSLQYVPD